MKDESSRDMYFVAKTIVNACPKKAMDHSITIEIG